jgi:hypothetical protein
VQTDGNEKLKTTTFLLLQSRILPRLAPKKQARTWGTRHGVDQKANGHMPHTFWEFYDTEYHAYQAESAVDKGVGSANETDQYSVWFPGITPQQRTTNITKDAYSNACQDVYGGACP